MKKTIAILILVVGLASNRAYGLSFTQEKQLSSIIALFEDRYDTKEEKIQTLNNLIALLSNAKRKIHGEKEEMIDFMEQETTKRIQLYQGVSTETLPYQKIRDKRETLHNNVRETPITQNPKLNKSAQLRAEYLAKNQIKAGNTHKRSTQDNYYDYNKITGWFTDLGIGFGLQDGRTFSESISYNTVRCKNENCEKEVERATDKSRQFLYESEKNRNGSHYRAIIEPNFKYIGIGIALTENKKRYYIVIHYATDVIDI